MGSVECNVVRSGPNLLLLSFFNLGSIIQCNKSVDEKRREREKKTEKKFLLRKKKKYLLVKLKTNKQTKTKTKNVEYCCELAVNLTGRQLKRRNVDLLFRSKSVRFGEFIVH